MSTNGKGSRQRQALVPDGNVARNWRRVFKDRIKLPSPRTPEGRPVPESARRPERGEGPN